MSLRLMTDLTLLKDYALQFVGTNYLWGGDDPILGYDCSGFIQELLMSVGIDPPGDQTAQALYNHFKSNGSRALSRGYIGALVFYGRGPHTISHVGMCLDGKTTIEAGGGNARTKTKQAASAQNAFIRLRPLRNRRDIVEILLPNY